MLEAVLPLMARITEKMLLGRKTSCFTGIATTTLYTVPLICWGRIEEQRMLPQRFESYPKAYGPNPESPTLDGPQTLNLGQEVVNTTIYRPHLSKP